MWIKSFKSIYMDFYYRKQAIIAPGDSTGHRWFKPVIKYMGQNKIISSLLYFF